MKNIVLRVPTAIFIALVFLPLMIFVLEIVAERELMEPRYYDILDIVGSVVISIWLFSIVDYFQSKAPEFKFTGLIYILLAIELILDLLVSFDILTFDGVNYLIPIAVQSIIYITATVFIILLIHKVFYERAVWFIVLEILIVIVGITTLTPEIKRNEQEILVKGLNEN